MPGSKKKFHHTSPTVDIVGAVPPSTARIMVALLRVYGRDGRATMREVAVEADRSLVVTHKHLHILQRLGLVECSDAKVLGALRPLVQSVAIRR